MTSRTLAKWEPEDGAFWASTGRRIARRNLIFSIFAEHLGFSVWTLWSVVVVALTLPLVMARVPSARDPVVGPVVALTIAVVSFIAMRVVWRSRKP